MPVDFAHPEYLAFFALLLPLAGAWVAYELWYRRTRKRVGDRPLIEAMTASLDRRGHVIRRAMQLIAIALLITAIARPQWGEVDEEITQEALDVVFAIDLSRSMFAEDIAPDRMTAAFQEVQRTVDGLHSDRVGLVIFTSISFVQSPLTSDHTAINFFLDRLHPDQIPVSGTNIGAALDDSVDVLTGHGDDDDRIQASEEQVIVLMTDGEDHESEPRESAREAAEQGIRIAAVGIGDPEGAHIPIDDDTGQRRDYVRDNDGEKVVSKADHELLSDMADITDGIHITFEEPGQASTQIIDFLDDLERSVVEERVVDYRVDRFMWFLVPAALLLLCSLFVGRRRRRLLPVALALTIIVSTGCDATLQRLDPEAAEAIDAIEDGDYATALDILDTLPDEKADLPETHFNRGRALMGLDEFEDARTAFATALSADDPDLRADAHYHIGLSFAAEDEWADADDHFRQGLRLFAGDDGAEDDELRDALRENLEVVLRELYPPCATFEDDFEPNDAPDDAATPQQWPVDDLTLCGDSDDYFSTAVFPGGELSVEATFDELRDEPDPEHVFLPDAADLELVVYGPDGQTILESDAGEDTTESELHAQNERRQTTRSVDGLELEEHHFDTAPGEQTPVFIALRAAEDLEFSYELDVEHTPPCEVLDDEFEPNSTADDAAGLPAEMGHQLYLCAGDEDWFRLSAKPGDSLFVDLRPEADELHSEPPELDVELLRADTREIVGVGHRDGTYITAGIDDIDFDADLLLRVRGADDEQEGPYVADVYHFEPCPEGTDRYHPNHELLLATHLPEEEHEHRFLRLCDDDIDHFVTTHESQADGVQWTIDILPENAWQGVADPDVDRPFGRFPDIDLDLLDVRGGAELHTTARPPDDDARSRLTEPRHLDTDDSPHDEDAVLRVRGEPGFYHLRRPDDSDGDGDDDQQDESQDDSGDDEDDDRQDEQDDDEQDDDGQDDDGQDGQDDDEEEREDGDREDDDPTEADDPEGPDESEAPEMSQEQIDDILRSIEDEDDNFQLRRTIEDTPPQRIEREW